MNKNVFIGSVVVLLAIVGLYSVGNTQKSAKDLVSKNQTAVNFGAVLALSGYAAIDGENIKDGIELARADLAKQGIVLNVEYYDDGTDPKKTITGVELMNSKGIKTIFGPTWSYQITAALPTINRYGMTAYIADTSSDIVEGDVVARQSLVHGVSPIHQITDPTVGWIKDNEVTNLAVLTVDGAWGIAHAEAWKIAALKSGIRVGMVEIFDYVNEPTILSNLVVKAKSQGIDGIVWTGTEAGAVVLVKKMQELDFNVPVLGTNYLKVASDTKKIEVGNYNLSMIESARSEAFTEKYRAVFKREPNKYAESSYDLTMIAVMAELRRGDQTTREFIMNNTHQGFAKDYQFDEMGDITNLAWSVTKL